MGWIKKLGENLFKDTFWPHDEPAPAPPSVPTVDYAAQAAEEAARKAALKKEEQDAARKAADDFYSMDKDCIDSPTDTEPTIAHAEQEVLVSEYTTAQFGG
jgi:hypothetical protein